MTTSTTEVIVVGGGPAGLSAALVLARYNRRVALFDKGGGRSQWAQINRNFLGFPGGIPAKTIRVKGREQLASFDHVQILDTPIDSIRKEGDTFIAATPEGGWHAGALILCTGTVDRWPRFDGWQSTVGRSMFWCLTCDAYDAIGKQVVMVGNTNDAACMALQMTRFTRKLTLLTNSPDVNISDIVLERLKAFDIPLIVDEIESAEIDDGMIQALITAGGQRLPVELVFSHQGADPRSEFALALGVEVNDLGYIVVDTEQKTNVPGVYAAGDVTYLHSHQISAAVHEGAQAASAANYYLYPPELKDL